MDKKQVNINIDPTIKPLFADEVAVVSSVKQNNKEDKEKEGNLSLIFIDTFSQKAVARVVLSRITAKALVGILKKAIEELDKKVKTKGDLRDTMSLKSTSDPQSYIG